MKKDKQFLEACKNGHLSTAKRIAQGDRTFTLPYPLAFREACRESRIDMAQWLHDHLQTAKLTDLGVKASTLPYARTFREACCEGRIRVAQWLHGLKAVDFNENFERLPDDTFFDGDDELYHGGLYGYLLLAKLSGQGDVAKWLQSLPELAWVSESDCS